MEGETPTVPIKLICAFYYITSILVILAGAFFIFGGGVISSLIPLIGFLGAGIFIITGIILVGIGIFGFILARGLYLLKKWAKIIVFIFSVLGIFSSAIILFIGQLVAGIIYLTINLLIVGYLVFSKKIFVFN